MSDQLVPLRELTEPWVAVRWHEAVALVLAIAQGAEREGGMPSLDAIALTQTGDISFVSDGPAIDCSVAALGALLDSLVTRTPAPEELRQFAARGAGASPGEPTAAWLDALAFFERPDRASQLAALAARAAALRDRQPGDAQMRQLEARARSRAAEADREPGTPMLWWMSRAARPIALGVIAASLSATAWVWRAELRRALVPVWYGLSSALPTHLLHSTPWLSAWQASAVIVEEVPGPSQEATPGSPGGRRPAPDAVARTNMEPAPAAGEPAPVAQSLPAPSGIPESSASAQDGAAADAVVYSEADSDVQPPVFLGLPLPSSRGFDFESAGVFNLTIDEAGRVHRVHLVSPAARFHERMLLAAAKAWRFTPATRNGQPVWYRTHVRITW
jgi:hypothetical protein